MPGCEVSILGHLLMALAGDPLWHIHPMAGYHPGTWLRVTNDPCYRFGLESEYGS